MWNHPCYVFCQVVSSWLLRAVAIVNQLLLETMVHLFTNQACGIYVEKQRMPSRLLMMPEDEFRHNVNCNFYLQIS